MGKKATIAFLCLLVIGVSGFFILTGKPKIDFQKAGTDIRTIHFSVNGYYDKAYKKTVNGTYKITTDNTQEGKVARLEKYGDGKTREESVHTPAVFHENMDYQLGFTEVQAPVLEKTIYLTREEFTDILLLLEEREVYKWNGHNQLDAVGGAPGFYLGVVLKDGTQLFTANGLGEKTFPKGFHSFCSKFIAYLEDLIV